MPARTRVGLSENTRKRIQCTQIVNRLQKHVDGEVDMSATQVRAAEVLLRKVLPDLSSIDMDASVEGKLIVNIVRHADVDPAA